jgi:mannitol/fructose-specific phosphotransferase system IIA component (Ntr-type)
MNLKGILPLSDIHLLLRGTTKNEVVAELVDRLHLDPESTETILKVVQRRESLGSTGVGAGLALPHCRTALVDRLRVIYGRQPSGINFEALDGRPVHHFFLLVAPPVEVSNDYLPVLGAIARLARNPEVMERLTRATTAAEVQALLGEAKA